MLQAGIEPVKGEGMAVMEMAAPTVMALMVVPTMVVMEAAPMTMARWRIHRLKGRGSRWWILLFLFLILSHLL
jgi:hypothetical protein